MKTEKLYVPGIGVLCLISTLTLFFHQGCELPPDVHAAALTSLKNEPVSIPKLDTLADVIIGETNAEAADIIARQQVPILCYHQVRDWRPTDSKIARDYIVPPASFAAQMKALADSGYTTILPNQLYNYLVGGKTLPSKPVILSFDDSDLEQYTVALPEMNRYGFKGVFFIMTVSLGRPNYMSKEQVKDISDRGHVIGLHTWDHQNVKKYAGDDWAKQIEKPAKQLQSITGKPVQYFAYPFGLWNRQAIPELKKRDIHAAFQLSEKRDPDDPLYTIRRIIVPGTLTGPALIRRMKQSFH